MEISMPVGAGTCPAGIQEFSRSLFPPLHSPNCLGWGFSGGGFTDLHAQDLAHADICRDHRQTALSVNSCCLLHLWKSGAKARLYRKWQVLNYCYNLFSVY